MGDEKLLKMIPQGFEFTVLNEIKKQEPSCSAQDVAAALKWDEKKVEAIMESLYEKGWIERAN